jgi:transposase-like protein
MRKSKFSETQIVAMLKDAESGVPVADLLRKHGVRKATFFKWRSKYGGATDPAYRGCWAELWDITRSCDRRVNRIVSALTTATSSRTSALSGERSTPDKPRLFGLLESEWDMPRSWVMVSAMARDSDSDTLFENPFSNLEDAHQYLSLLTEALDEARDTIQEDLAITRHLKGGERRVEALQLVDFKLHQLRAHFSASRAIVNDLRTLRRLIFAEREESTSATAYAAVADGS